MKQDWLQKHDNTHDLSKKCSPTYHHQMGREKMDLIKYAHKNKKKHRKSESESDRNIRKRTSMLKFTFIWNTSVNEEWQFPFVSYIPLSSQTNSKLSVCERAEGRRDIWEKEGSGDQKMGRVWGVRVRMHAYLWKCVLINLICYSFPLSHRSAWLLEQL